jgi:hypothetical protein
MYFIYTHTTGKHRETPFPLYADFKILKIFELKRMGNKLKQSTTGKHRATLFPSGVNHKLLNINILNRESNKTATKRYTATPQKSEICK